jgi:hypothetical protein
MLSLPSSLLSHLLSAPVSPPYKTQPCFVSTLRSSSPCSWCCPDTVAFFHYVHVLPLYFICENTVWIQAKLNISYVQERNLLPNLFFNLNTKCICYLFAVSWAKHGYL